MEPHIVGAFCCRTKFLPAVERKVFRLASYTHVGILDGDHVIEALLWKGVVSTPLDEWKARYPNFELKAKHCPNPEAGLAFARGQLRKGYDYRGAFGVPFRANWDDPNTWWCSELFEATLVAAGRRRFESSKFGIHPMESYLVV